MFVLATLCCSANIRIAKGLINAAILNNTDIKTQNPERRSAADHNKSAIDVLLQIYSCNSGRPLVTIDAFVCEELS